MQKTYAIITSVNKRMKVFGLLIVSCFFVFSLMGASAFSLSFKANQMITFTVNPTLNLTISGDLTISSLVPGEYEDSNVINIDLSTNVQNGYFLSATTGTSTTDDKLTNQDNSNYFFTSLSTTANLPDMSIADANTWGYSYNVGSTGWSGYSGLPLDADDTGETGAILIDTSTPADSQNVQFKIAANASSFQPAGTYTNIINFYAVSKPTPQPKTIENLEYMQEFATLDEGDKATVLASMEPDQQYTLKDNRDEKEYFIAKLQDGNVWMTQNLDHDIVTTPNFYTSENTDILESRSPLTMGAATRVASDTVWNGSVYLPESYDPGELCWNGVIDHNWRGVITNVTAPCTNVAVGEHYSLGNYYNWNAAVAINNSSSYVTDLYDIDQSICPAGWRLPPYSGNKSFQNLVSALQLKSDIYDGSNVLYNGNIQNSPVYFIYAGSWRGNSNNFYIGSLGTYWTSVTRNDVDSSILYFEDNDVGPLYTNNRSAGNSVRCVAR